jgi:hypothetical protein
MAGTPVDEPRGTGRRRWRIGALAALAAAALILAVALLPWRGWPERAPPQAPSQQAPAPAQTADAGVTAEALPPAEVALRLARAGALASCEGEAGTALFLEPERAVSRIACAGQVVALALADGRELLGKVVGRDGRVGAAVLEVPGAAASPVTLGDSTALASGDLLYQAAEGGTEIAVRERRLLRTGRVILGMAFLETEPAPAGDAPGALVDPGGRLVGFPAGPLAPGESDLFLPVEYLRPLLPGLPAAPEAAERWRRTLERAQEEDRREAERFSRRFAGPALVQARVAGPGLLDAVLAQRWSGPPRQVDLPLVALDEGRVLCAGSAAAREWLSAEEALRRLALDGPLARLLRWARERRAADDLFLSAVLVVLRDCPVERASPRAVLAVEGGEQADVRFPRAALLDADAQASAEAEASRREAAESRARRAQEEQERARSEASWRKAFGEVHERIARLEARRAALRDEEDRAWSYQQWFDLDRVRRETAEVEASLAEARQDLAELERQASFQAVPREWRR